MPQHYRTNKEIAERLFGALLVLSTEGEALKEHGESEAAIALDAAWFLVKQAMKRIGGEI